MLALRAAIPLVFVLLATASLSAGCGSVSGVKAADRKAPLNLSAYERVVVHDFTDRASARAKPSARAAKREEMTRVGRDFAQVIAAELAQRNCFRDVAYNGRAAARTLLINGAITRHEEGSAAARLIVGMGVGSSYFDAIVEFRDATSGLLLGTMNVDKNSWVLGGGLAAGQNPQTFMREAARKLAGEIERSRRRSGHDDQRNVAR